MRYFFMFLREIDKTMRYAVRIINAISIAKLEEEVNKWLDKEKDIHIQDIRFEFNLTPQGGHRVTVLILYKRGIVYLSRGAVSQIDSNSK